MHIPIACLNHVHSHAIVKQVTWVYQICIGSMLPSFEGTAKSGDKEGIHKGRSEERGKIIWSTIADCIAKLSSTG